MSTRRLPLPRPLLVLVAVAALVPTGLACRDDGSAAERSAATTDGAGRTDGGSPVDGPWFHDAAAESGLDFHHFNGGRGDFHMVEILGSGAALFDYDGDGDLDAYLVQGAPLGTGSGSGSGASADDALFPLRHPAPPSDRLYRNDLTRGADGRPRLAFTDVTGESGLAGVATGYGMGVAAGDYDGDGDLDLYVTNYGPDQLLENLGDGTFRDATAASGFPAFAAADPAGTPEWSVPAAFFDMDDDGDLDLFVGNYVAFSLVDPPICRDLTGSPDFCGPKAFPSQADRLWENRGDGTFRDVTRRAGLTGGFGPALGVVAADFDGDHRTDLYVANDAAANNLWHALGGGRYEDRALLAGAAVDESGSPQGSMGVDAGDFDADGDLDLFMTHIDQETNTLYRNEGDGMFEDMSAETGLGAPSLPVTGFGTAWFDYDNDGWLDLLVVNGAVTKIPALVRAGEPFPLHQPNQLFRNLGGDGRPGRFAEVTDRAGPVFELSEVSRGAAFGDIDEDGDVDVLVTNNAGPARLLINRVGAARGWIGVRLLTADGSRDAVGARAALLVDGSPALWRRVRPEGSFAVANDPRLLFGLGGEIGPEDVDGLRVVWADGGTEDFPAPPPGRYTPLRRGGGAGKSSAAPGGSAP